MIRVAKFGYFATIWLYFFLGWRRQKKTFRQLGYFLATFLFPQLGQVIDIWWCCSCWNSSKRCQNIVAKACFQLPKLILVLALHKRHSNTCLRLRENCCMRPHFADRLLLNTTLNRSWKWTGHSKVLHVKDTLQQSALQSSTLEIGYPTDYLLGTNSDTGLLKRH